MTVITDCAMSSDQTSHTAHWATDPLGGWVVSWLPGRRMGRVLAITAMTLAEAQAREVAESKLAIAAQQAVDRLAEVA